MELKHEERTPECVLVIVAHHDDIEFGMAGSVARWREHGAQVVYCVITDGSAGSNDPQVNPEELARRRAKEQLAAAATVGVTDVRFLSYRDGVLQPTLEVRRDLTRLIREIRPDRVVAMDPTAIFINGTYINHPDHRAAGEAAIYATFPSAGTRPIIAELLAEGLEPHDVRELYLGLTLEPNLAVDITPYIDRKIEALLCHRSQVGLEASDLIRGWDAESGRRAGVEYAELYRVIRLVEDETQPARD